VRRRAAAAETRALDGQETNSNIVTSYETVQRLLQVAPLTLVPALMFAFRKQRASVRYLSVILLGWAVLFVFVVLYWDFSADYAPDERLAAEVASRDGAPTTFALLFGWVFVAVYVALLEAVRVTWLWSRRQFQSRHGG